LSFIQSEFRKLFRSVLPHIMLEFRHILIIADPNL
jgi:hypothetical protein